MKKLLSIITAILIVSVVAVLCITSASAAFVPGADSFVPEQISVKKASAAITIDGEAVPDAGYGSNTVTLTGEYESPNVSCTAHLAWDETYIYIHMVVNDSSKYIDTGAQFSSDSIEFYVDFDNNKNKYNKLMGNANGIYAAQYRVQRGSKSSNPVDFSVSGNADVMEPLAKDSMGAVKEYGDSAYVVEIAFAHNNYALANVIGFALQVNDGNPGSQSRDGILFSNPAGETQNQCYKYTSFLDIATLEGFVPTTNRTMAANDVAVDDTVVSVTSKPASSKPSTSSKPTSNAVSSAPASAAASSTAASTVTSAPSATGSNAASTVASTVESVADTEVDTNVSTPADVDEGGLPMGALIAIIAGGVIVLAGGAVAVILVLKKKAK